MFFFKWIRSFQHPKDKVSVLLNGVCFIRLQVALVFPPSHPFLQGTRFLIQVSFYWCEASPFFFPSIFLSGDAHKDTNGASSSSLFILFLLRWIQFKILVLIISFPCFRSFIIPVLIIFIHFSLFNYSGVLKMSQKICVPIISPSKNLSRMLSHPSYLTQPVQYLSSNRSTVFILSGP